MQQLDEQIAHYKDQIQELKAKSNLEAKYVKKESQVKGHHLEYLLIFWGIERGGHEFMYAESNFSDHTLT